MGQDRRAQQEGPKMELIRRDALELSQMLDRGEVSTTEVMQAALDRIAAVNGQINAITCLRDPDALLAEARAAETAARPSFLAGLPVAVKDLANVAGLPNSQGSLIFRDAISATDDLAIGRMRAAGALFIGKTNVPEFGLGSHSVNPVHGGTTNPHAPGRSAGGSSGGAAAALAAGMQWVCDGSDMMGSLRNPAGWCNVYGFRPTWGRVPAEPVGDVFLHQLSTLGPMARNVRDLTALLDVMAGHDPRQPLSLDHQPMLPRLEADVTGRRIGWLGDWGGAYPMEAGVMEHCAAALSTFADMGCVVEEVAPPMPAADLWDSWRILRAFANAARLGALHDDPARRALMKPDAIWEVEQGKAVSVAEVQRASALRSEWHGVTEQLFDRYDALVLPTAQVWPFAMDDWPNQIAGRAMDTYHRWMEVVIPASLTGLPALAVPAGFGPGGLPMGLQIIGRRRADLGVLQLGEAWHQATGWPQRAWPDLG
nr:amidase [Pseudooceanicola aestuarii]